MARRTKYTPETVKLITDALEEGKGRVRAVKGAGVSYQTFMNWIDSHVEFFEAIKKAELTGNDKIKDICKRRIIEDKSWQSAAWWLERKYPKEFGRDRHLKQDTPDTQIKVIFDKDVTIQGKREDGD